MRREMYTPAVAALAAMLLAIVSTGCSPGSERLRASSAYAPEPRLPTAAPDVPPAVYEPIYVRPDWVDRGPAQASGRPEYGRLRPAPRD